MRKEAEIMSKLEEARKIINEVDKEMAVLFTKRMHAVELVYEYKKEHGMPILDEDRERAVIAKNSAFVADPVIKEYYIDYLKNVMSLSRAYQHRLQNGLKVSYSDVEGAVVNGESDVAVPPIENSSAGEV